jgi:hypothetical protein
LYNTPATVAFDPASVLPTLPLDPPKNVSGNDLARVNVASGDWLRTSELSSEMQHNGCISLTLIFITIQKKINAKLLLLTEKKNKKLIIPQQAS